MIERTAVFSHCRRYRYSLWRIWSGLLSTGKGYALFVGLNPSTADETFDDPTIRRCVGFARSWGYDGLCMANLFAFRATDPAEMLSQADPVGEENDRYLVECAAGAGVVVTAWGVCGVHRGRDLEVRALLPDLHYLKLTKDGHPSHPLYLPGNLRPVPWE
jgi:hypothetical protein